MLGLLRIWTVLPLCDRVLPLLHPPATYPLTNPFMTRSTHRP